MSWDNETSQTMTKNESKLGEAEIEWLMRRGICFPKPMVQYPVQDVLELEPIESWPFAAYFSPPARGRHKLDHENTCKSERLWNVYIVNHRFLRMPSPLAPRSRGNCRAFDQGFTLVELLAVMAVIAILAALTLMAMGGINRKAAMDQTRVEVAAIANALEQYKSVNDYYPDDDPNEDYKLPASTVLPFLGSSKVNISDGKVIDPFGAAYIYKKPGTRNPASFDLWSAGSDSQSATDDIGNW